MDDDLLVALRVLEQNQRRMEGKLDALIAALAEDADEGSQVVNVSTLEGPAFVERGDAEATL